MGIIARLDNVVNGLKTRLEAALGSIERMEQDEAELRSSPKNRSRLKRNLRNCAVS